MYWGRLASMAVTSALEKDGQSAQEAKVGFYRPRSC